MALLFSDFKPIVDLGALVAMALFSSGVMTILLVTLVSPWFFAAIVPVARTPERTPVVGEHALS